MEGDPGQYGNDVSVYTDAGQKATEQYFRVRAELARVTMDPADVQDITVGVPEGSSRATLDADWVCKGE